MCLYELETFSWDINFEITSHFSILTGSQQHSLESVMALYCSANQEVENI